MLYPACFGNNSNDDLRFWSNYSDVYAVEGFLFKMGIFDLFGHYQPRELDRGTKLNENKTKTQTQPRNGNKHRLWTRWDGTVGLEQLE